MIVMVTLTLLGVSTVLPQALAVPIIDTGNNPASSEWAQGTIENSVKVSNLVEQGCAISWITDIPSDSTVEVYSDSGGTTPIASSPFTSNYFGASSTKHYVQVSSGTISTAAAGTTFYFCVKSSDGVEDRAPSTGFYTFTKVAASGVSSGYNVWGNVLDSGGNPVAGAIVYLNDTTKNSPLLSMVTDVDGVWYFDLYAIRDSTGTLVTPIPTAILGDNLHVEAWVNGDGNATILTYSYQCNDAAEQLPDMTLSPPPLGEPAGIPEFSHILLPVAVVSFVGFVVLRKRKSA